MDQKKKILEKKKMSIVRKIFNDQYSQNELIDLLGKRYDVNEKDVFRWLCLNKVGDYCMFLRICKLASNCRVKKHDKGFDIIVNVEKK